MASKKKDRAARVEELHEQLTAGLAELVASDDWAALLETAARFHRYSPGNVMLILAQRPDASRVAGYRTWQALGRQVRKGETGIRILAPCAGTCRDCDGDGCLRCGGSGRYLFFRVVSVFDIAQTDGEPLADVSPGLLDSDDVPAGLWDALAEQVDGAGFALTVTDGDVDGRCPTAEGVTDFAARTVQVRGDRSAADRAATLAHELAHVLLHDPSDPDESRPRDRRLREVEAESVAYIVCAAAGLDASACSVPYVAGWAGGDLDMVRRTAERVLTCASRVLAALSVDEAAEVSA